jgi:hypothetical protein
MAVRRQGLGRQGLRWAVWGLAAVGLLAVAGRLGAGRVGPVVPAPPATGQAPAPPTTVAVPVAREPAGLPESPVRAAFDGHVLWVAGRRVVYHVLAGKGYDAATPLAPPSGGVLDVTAGAGGVWLAVDDPGSVWRLDAVGQPVARIPLGRALTGTVRIAASSGGRDRGDAVWVACCGRDTGAVLRLDPATNRVVGAVPLPNGPISVAADRRGAVVITQFNELVEIPAGGGEPQVVLRLSPGSKLHDVVLAADAAWLTVPYRGVVLRRPRSDGRLQSFLLPRGVRALAAARSGVWALSQDGLALTPLQEGSLPPYGLIPTGDDPARQLITGRDALWLVPARGPAVVRVRFPRNPELDRI